MERYRVYYVGDKHSTLRFIAFDLCVSMHDCTNATEKIRFNHNLEASRAVLGSLFFSPNTDGSVTCVSLLPSQRQQTRSIVFHA